MQINEASKNTGLTKKAIEYYTEQGLVAPSVLGNGYRQYSEQDIERLHKISVLRALDVGTAEIREILADETNTALHTAALKKELELQRDTVKKKILEKLSTGEPYAWAFEELRSLQQNRTITEKLLEAFPGYFGRFICLHFARFLDEPLQTAAQQSAYDTIIDFLDNVPPLDLPQDLEEYLIEGTKDIGTVQMRELLASTKQSMEHPEDFIAENKEILEQYLAYKQSEEYRSSPACRLMEEMKKFYSTSGYYDIFIPAMKQLSAAYARYHTDIEAANRKLLAAYPEIEKLNQ